MSRLRALTVGSLLVLAAVPVASLAQSDSRLWPPAIVADSFFAATRDARWSDAARFLDLDAVSAMRDQRVKTARAQPPARKMTAEDFLRVDPKMPRVAAEYQARQSNENRSRGPDLLGQEYARVPSIDSLARLPQAEVAARWLEARDDRWQLRPTLLEYQKRGCISADSVEVILRAMRPPATEILGTVLGDSISFVLHEPSIIRDGGDAARDPADTVAQYVMPRYLFPPAVTTLRRIGGAWRIIPGYDRESSATVVDLECVPPRKRNGK